MILTPLVAIVVGAWTIGHGTVRDVAAWALAALLMTWVAAGVVIRRRRERRITTDEAISTIGFAVVLVLIALDARGPWLVAAVSPLLVVRHLRRRRAARDGTATANR